MKFTLANDVYSHETEDGYVLNYCMSKDECSWLEVLKDKKYLYSNFYPLCTKAEAQRQVEIAYRKLRNQEPIEHNGITLTPNKRGEWVEKLSQDISIVLSIGEGNSNLFHIEISGDTFWWFMEDKNPKVLIDSAVMQLEFISNNLLKVLDKVL